MSRKEWLVVIVFFAFTIGLWKGWSKRSQIALQLVRWGVLKPSYQPNANRDDWISKQADSLTRVYAKFGFVSYQELDSLDGKVCKVLGPRALGGIWGGLNALVGPNSVHCGAVPSTQPPEVTLRITHIRETAFSLVRMSGEARSPLGWWRDSTGTWNEFTWNALFHERPEEDRRRFLGMLSVYGRLHIAHDPSEGLFTEDNLLVPVRGNDQDWSHSVDIPWPAVGALTGLHGPVGIFMHTDSLDPRWGTCPLEGAWSDSSDARFQLQAACLYDEAGGWEVNWIAWKDSVQLCAGYLQTDTIEAWAAAPPAGSGGFDDACAAIGSAVIEPRKRWVLRAADGTDRVLLWKDWLWDGHLPEGWSKRLFEPDSVSATKAVK